MISVDSFALHFLNISFFIEKRLNRLNAKEGDRIRRKRAENADTVNTSSIIPNVRWKRREEGVPESVVKASYAARSVEICDDLKEWLAIDLHTGLDEVERVTESPEPNACAAHPKEYKFTIGVQMK